MYDQVYTGLTCGYKVTDHPKLQLTHDSISRLCRIMQGQQHAELIADAGAGADCAGWVRRNASACIVPTSAAARCTALQGDCTAHTGAGVKCGFGLRCMCFLEVDQDDIAAECSCHLP